QIPLNIVNIYSQYAVKLDLSFNIIDNLDGIEKFTNLKELILDNNLIKDDSIKLSYNSSLHTLSLNKNKLTDLERLLTHLSEKCPNLTFLSLLGNNACPDQLSNNSHNDEQDYERYRRYVIYRLPFLKFLDSTRVTGEERRDANLKGQYLRTIRPNDQMVLTDHSNTDTLANTLKAIAL
ncbi:unnamed protein product, partial [Medioppia subpectinata]